MTAPVESPASEAYRDGFRDVFVPQDESERALSALGYADGVCVHFNAHLSGLMIGLVPYYPMSASASANPDGWMRAQRQASEEAGAAEARLRAVYGRLSALNSLNRVDAFEQEAGRICARRARTADLTIVGWPPGDAGDVERAIFEACLFDSGRPILLTPRDQAFRAPPLRALVAWNGSREAARAIREALPLLRRTRLTRIVTIDSGEADSGGFEDMCAQLEKYLVRHQVMVETKRAHGGGREMAVTLADEAEQFGAGLVVLGGYGYMRGGQWVYGGGTRSVLELARTPMLMAC